MTYGWLCCREKLNINNMVKKNPTLQSSVLLMTRSHNLKGFNFKGKVRTGQIRHRSEGFIIIIITWYTKLWTGKGKIRKWSSDSYQPTASWWYSRNQDVNLRCWDTSPKSYFTRVVMQESFFCRVSVKGFKIQFHDQLEHFWFFRLFKKHHLQVLQQVQDL